MTERFWTPAKLNLLKKLYVHNEDLTYSDLVKLTGCSSRNQIAGAINRLVSKGEVVRKENGKQPGRLKRIREKRKIATETQILLDTVPAEDTSNFTKIADMLDDVRFKNKADCNYPSKFDEGLFYEKLRSNLDDGRKCKWPVITENRKHLFCYNDRKFNAAYCEGHCKEAYNGAPPPMGGNRMILQNTGAMRSRAKLH